ncbi:Multidrug resistance outer membrane protein MdtP precursor [Legionella massiliensis]|uniref:Multidrug resistance outer membrane protein MdtP n=2 Tax=Legionella massiliensis TaxID=1034943 RepID=A0A078L0P2_9GAMM|nr:Multidrug resistance outer membrane protein MdtP precursor [Legionella massiliensis]CEE13316.1 Multidrug resistance outer membrane protein MdtP precursor [Legionella massiliensis]
MLLSCGINLPPERQVQNLKTVPNMDQTLKKNLKKSDIFTKGDWPRQRWWQAYGSAELNSLIAEALSSNPSIQEINSRVMAAKQEAIITGSLLFPLVFFDATENRQYLSKNGLYRALNHTIPLDANLLDLSLSFNYEFDFWGQNRNLFRAALGEARAQEAEAAEVELITATALSQAYMAYKTNLIRKQLYEQLVDIRKNLAGLQNLLLRKGLSSELPAFSAKENLLDAEKLLSSIHSELKANKHLINVLAGRAPDSPLATNNPLPALPGKLAIPQTLSLDLIARRPDLMAQIWRAKALAYETGAAMAEYYPNINLVGLIGLESVRWEKLFDNSSSTRALRPAISLPIFTAGAIRANINEKQAEFDAAIFAYNNLLLRSSQEILDVLAFAEDVYRQKKEQTTIVNYAEQRYGLVRLRQQKGLDSQFDNYALKEEVIQKKLINVTLLYNQYLASIKLAKALGGGYSQSEVPLVGTFRVKKV